MSWMCRLGSFCFSCSSCGLASKTISESCRRLNRGFDFGPTVVAFLLIYGVDGWTRLGSCIKITSMKLGKALVWLWLFCPVGLWSGVLLYDASFSVVARSDVLYSWERYARWRASCFKLLTRLSDRMSAILLSEVCLLYFMIFCALDSWTFACGLRPI